MFPAPVYTRWEYIGMASIKFVEKMNDFKKIALGITNTEKTSSQRSKIASDLKSLLEEPALLTMVLFLYCYHTSFWQPHFQWLKMIDPISKVSGYASRHMSTRTFIMHKQLQNITQLWATDESFKLFNERRPLHTNTESTILFDTLPAAFLEDAHLMFAKHFVRQWISNKLLLLTLASIPEVSKAFSRWLLNKPIKNITIKCDLHKDEIHLLSCISFITSKADLNEIKKQHFFTKYLPAIEKISEGASLFESEDSDVRLFKKYIKENWIPLPLATQLVESKVKDTTFCKSTGKSEWNTSNLTMIRSFSIPMVISAIKESDNFKLRVRRKDDAKNYFCNMKFNEEILASNFKRQKELVAVSEADKAYSKTVLLKENHYHIKH